LLADPRVDPTMRNNYALQWAEFYKHLEIIDLLLHDDRVLSSLTEQEFLKYKKLITEGNNE
jgi:hypothetical protein